MKEIEEMIKWYETIFTGQMVKGSNINFETMARNLAVLKDAYYSFAQFKGIDIWSKKNG
jgi:hypothetical protein